MKPLTVYHRLEDTVWLLCKVLKTNLLQKSTNRGRTPSLSPEQSITFGLYKQTQNIATKKALYTDFQPTCSYKTFVVSLNRFAFQATLIFKMILKRNKKHAHIVKHTDSTDIPVCLNKNAKRHKTMQNLASWGHSGKGLCYGLKLHLTQDLDRHVLSVVFATGGRDDRGEFMRVNKDLWGIFVADAGYVSEKLEKEFFQEGKRLLIAKPRKNMRKLASEIDLLLYATRMTIEINFRNLKMLWGMITSLPRSIDGYLAHYAYCLLAHVLV